MGLASLSVSELTWGMWFCCFKVTGPKWFWLKKETIPKLSFLAHSHLFCIILYVNRFAYILLIKRGKLSAASEVGRDWIHCKGYVQRFMWLAWNNSWTCFEIQDWRRRILFMSLFLGIKPISKFKILLVNSGKYFPTFPSVIVVNFHFNLFL